MRIKLRLEPYDPDARDADGDGIVQEGTAWERPAGTKILDGLGNEIARGLTSPYRNTSFKIIDRNGRNLDYRPTYGTDADLNPKESKPTLEKLGYQTLKAMGLPTIGDTVLPSTKPRVETVETPTSAPASKPRYPRIPPAHAMTGLAEEKFGSARTWEEFREIMKDTDIVFLDYETTGIVFDEFGRASSNGQPTQIGAVRMRDGKVIERFNVFVNPGIPMSQWEPWSRDNLTDADGQKLTDEFFDDKPSIAEAHRQLLRFIGEGTILGMQNAVFDDAVLAGALEMSGIDWKPAGIIDTKEMSSMALPRWTPENPDGPNRVDPKTGETVPSNGLADITRYLGVDLGDKHHSADYDAEATGNVLTRIVDEAITNDWSTDFLDKEKRDSKLAANEAKFQQEIAKFEVERVIWEQNQAEVDRIEQQNRLDEQKSALSALLSEIASDGDGWEAGGKEAGELMRQWEEGELPDDFDDSRLDEEMFAIGEDAREMRFQRLESEISPEGAETLRVWIDGRDGATYSIRDEIEDRFLKPEDRAGQLADLVSPDRNSDAWKREYESQLSRIQSIQYRSDGAEALLEMIDNSPIQNQPLYRGMMLSPEQLEKLVQNGRINFPIGATSSSRNSALEYADRGGNQSVLFEIEGARAFPAHLFSRVDEHEFLVSGEFEIVSVGREDSFNGPVPVVKIRPTGRTYREHGRELLSGRDSDVVTPDGTDLHVQEIQAKQSADEASRLIPASLPELTPEQQETVNEIAKLINAMKSIGAGLTEDEFKDTYGVSLSLGDEVLPEDFGPDDDMSLLYVSRLFPSEIVGRDGSTYTSRPDFVEIRPNYVLVEGNIYDGDGRYVGEYSRRLRIDADKNLVAHHSVLDISEEHRNTGIGTAFNAQMERLYRSLGVDRIEVDASSSIRYEGDEKTPMDIQRGVSFWPRQGFDWQDDRYRQVTLQLFERLIDDPESVYVEGVSKGPRPMGTDRFDIAYFSSPEEWENFVDAFQRSKTASFDDPGRPVAGDLMRWNGADEWVARRSAGYTPTYVKRLNEPTVQEQSSPTSRN